jgi:hypothetical protein
MHLENNLTVLPSLSRCIRLDQKTGGVKPKNWVTYWVTEKLQPI